MPQPQHASKASPLRSSATSSKDGTMKDDYGAVDLSTTRLWTAQQFTLESGIELTDVPCRYQTYGQLNANRSNVMVICHALTGHQVVAEWWSSLLGDGKPFDTSKYFVICANMLGSCYGTAGPTTINPKTQKEWGVEFPYVTIRDTVTLHCKLLQHLQITHVAAVVGGSIGGMQALEWGYISQQPEFSFDVGTIVALACGAKQSAWAIALNHIQRNAIYNDNNYNNGQYSKDNPPLEGMASARELAMISYRTHHIYNQKFGRNLVEPKKANTADQVPTQGPKGQPNYQIESYLSYQGTKFQSRFDANSYVRMSQQTDSHDVGRNRGGVVKALRSLNKPILLIGIGSDVLYPTSDITELKEHLPDSELLIIDSPEGHDGFLLEQQQVGKAISQFLAKNVQLDGQKHPPAGKPVGNNAPQTGQATTHKSNL